MRRTAAFVVQPQFVSNFVLSGVADRFPGLVLVCAETGTGWLAYLMHACDRVWEREQLWREGAPTRPSEIIRRQVRATFWYEKAGIRMRDAIGVDNVMWASDYPHGTSTYPQSWDLIADVLDGVGEEDRRKLLGENVLATYGVPYEDRRGVDTATTGARS
jgi:predicted TIM-barrel fold metal-dependent hydrolase